MTWFDYIFLLAASAPAASLQESHLVSLRVGDISRVDCAWHYITYLMLSCTVKETEEKQRQDFQKNTQLGGLPLKGKTLRGLQERNDKTRYSERFFNNIPALALCGWQTGDRHGSYKSHHLCHQEHLVPGNKWPAGDLQPSGEWIYD